MKLLAVIISLVVTQSAMASFYDECEFSAIAGKTQKLAKLNGTVTEFENVLPIEIDAAVNISGHTDCQDHVGETRILNVGKQVFEEGDTLTLGYEHLNSEGPNGVQYKESWEVIEEGGLLNMHCTQLNRSLPKYEVLLRRPTTNVITMGTYHNVIILQDSKVLAKTEATRVDINSNIPSLHSIKAKDMVLKYRFVENSENLSAELRLPAGPSVQMNCRVF
ncbi:hypothetical protein N9D31_00730 [Oligoflexaceae bacterium]|nr:hypothetical protein [Oligoflexaceae bacterium]